jgi:hypothetical protein
LWLPTSGIIEERGIVPKEQELICRRKRLNASSTSEDPSRLHQIAPLIGGEPVWTPSDRDGAIVG